MLLISLSSFINVILLSLYVYGGYEINAGILSDFHRIDLSKKTYIWQSITGKNPKSSPGTYHHKELSKCSYILKQGNCVDRVEYCTKIKCICSEDNM